MRCSYRETLCLVAAICRHVLLTAVFLCGNSEELVSSEASPPSADNGHGAAEAALDADFVLPYYLNLSRATLVIQPTEVAKKQDQPLEVEISISGREDDRVMTAPLRLTLNPDAELRQTIDISGWPDGDYKTAIRCFTGGKEFGEAQIRWLRKQTIAPPSAPTEPLEVGGISTLFVDDWYIASSKGMVRKVHPAETFAVTTGRLNPDYPVQSPLGGIRLESDGTWVVRFKDRPRGGLKLPSRRFVAQSKDDGKTWTINEEKEAVSPARSPESQPSGKKEEARFLDPARDGPIDLKGVVLKHTGVGDPSQRTWGGLEMPLRVAYPVWKKSPSETVILAESASDWLTKDFHLHKDGEPGDWSDSNDNFLEFEQQKGDGKSAFVGQARLVLRYGTFRVPFDAFPAFRGGHYNRAMVIWRTGDGMNWTPSYFDPMKETDPPSLQGYGGTQFYAEGNRLSLCYYYAYHGFDQQVPVELRFSRDNVFWQRLSDNDSENVFAANGPWGSANFGYLYHLEGSAVEKNGMMYQLFKSMQNVPHHFFRSLLDCDPKPLADPNQLKQMFAGNEIPRYKYWKEMGGSWEGFSSQAHIAARTIGGMRYRKNGWVTYAPSGQEGEFTTKILTAGTTVRINGRTSDKGAIVVEVLDEQGKPLPDYCGDNAAVFRGDATEGRLAWKNGQISGLPPCRMRLRIKVANAELFALNWQGKKAEEPRANIDN